MNTIQNNKTPLVSILCTTFNQGGYLEQTIKSFLCQETSFDIEIIIHDDCSTDDTEFIVNKYIEKTNKRIKYIKSEVNLYSKNINLPIVNAIKHCSGEYIAFCEGDDYWIDNDKLEKQMFEMAKHSCEISFTQSFIDDGSGRFNKKIADLGNEIRVINPELVILGGGGYMPSPSLVFKKNIITNMPSWFVKAPVGDYFIQIMGSLQYGALYLPFASSVYRVEAKGSWSLARKHFSSSKLVNDSKSYEYIFNKLKEKNVLYKDDYNKALARELYYITTSLIRLREFKHAKKIIVKSYNYSSNLSFYQKFLYYSRNRLCFHYYMIYIKDVVKV